MLTSVLAGHGLAFFWGFSDDWALQSGARTGETRRGAVGLSPVRRRTWTQIAREREMAAGKGAPEK
jgi:hypothetical protein